MSYYTQKSWFELDSSATQSQMFSQLMFNTQDLNATQDGNSQGDNLTFDLSFFQSSNDTDQGSAQESSNGSQLFETQQQLVVDSSVVQIESQQSQSQSNYFQPQLQAEISFLEENSRNIFDDESEDMDVAEQTLNGSQVDLLESEILSLSSHSSHSAVALVEQILDDDSPDLPRSIRDLFSSVKTNHSDWTFMSILSGQLCHGSLPMSAYSNLKMSLLLSLASINAAKSPIPIVAVGQETSHANMIMKSVGAFADRFITTLLNFDGSSVTRQGVIEAGPLLMARHGVFYIGDWSGLSPKVITKLLREIETGQVTTEKVQQSLPLDCSTWTYWCGSKNMKKDSTVIDQFINVFGVPILFDDSLNETEIVDDILFDKSDADENFKISNNDMRVYLAYVSRQKVTMETEAEVMLKEYFAATRVIRPNALTTKSYEVLQQMAEAHAKLCLRSSVQRQDVLAAINISEKYIRALFDRDSYSSPLEPQFTSIDVIDVFQNQLYKWLSGFTKDILLR